MHAAITPAYGPAQVLETRELSRPDVGEREVLIEVRAAAVTAGDRRLRAADFPSFTALPGRLMIGVTSPRHAVQGTMFAGRVVAVGRAVTRFAVGDDVFGSTEHGAYAEYLALPQDGALARMPAGLGYDAAASIPYGGVTALRFLRDLAEVKPGDEVLIVGASGGVGRFAVQIAKHLGARVTAVASANSFELLRSLGADRVIDYHVEDFTDAAERWDVIFDVAGASSFGASRRVLTERGRYLTLFVSVGVLLQMALTALRGGPKAKFAVALGTAEDMEALRDLIVDGAIAPDVGPRFPLARIAEAHAAAEANALGTVMVTMEPEETALA